MNAREAECNPKSDARGEVKSDDYEIRLAEAGDVPSLPSIERRAVRLFEDWIAETGLTAASLEKVSSFEELDEARQRGRLWVALCGGEIVGFAQAMILGGTAHLDEIDVVPEHMRKGVGSRLIETVCRWARDAGTRRSPCRPIETFPGTGRSTRAAAFRWSTCSA